MLSVNNITMRFGPRVLFDFVMIGVFGGFYIVPLFALIWPPNAKSPWTSRVQTSTRART